MSDVLKVQHGGDHYKSRGIQPVEYWWANWGAAPFLAEINKLTTRFEEKGGALDLKKAIHYTQMLLDFRYGIKSDISFNENEAEGNIPFSNPPGTYSYKGKVMSAAEIAEDIAADAQKKERKVRRYPAVIYDNHDGDTVSAAIKLGMGLTLDEKCRLRGINAPEMNTVKGKQARNHLHDLLEEYDQDGDGPLPYTMVEIVEGDERDKYGRLLVRIIGINPGESDSEVDINQLMIDNGQAVEYMAWAENDESDYEHKYTLLHDACWELFNAPHQQHFAVRLNDKENAALEKIKDLISGD